MHTVILVPTRNRPELAAAAVQSVLSQLPKGLEIVVSDNSTEDAHRAVLRDRLAALESDHLRLISPAEPLAMTPHWTWALDTVLATTDASHVAVLTDRMLFKPGGLSTLLQAAVLHPDDVISYNHDMVDDAHRPVVLHLHEWSGRLVRLRSARLLRIGSMAIWHPALPRMLNCLVPLSALQAIRERFGSVFASNAPDHAFAYRCLAVRESILYLDEALMLHYALDRSNGSTYGRGVPSEDNLDFVRELGSAKMNERTLVPGFHTTMNAIVSEYCFVRGETGDAFPPVDVPSYLDAMELGIAELEDARLRAAMEALLAESDARYAPRRRLLRRVRRLRHQVGTLKSHRTRAIRLALERGARAWSDGRDPSNWLFRQLDRLALLDGGPRTATFTTSEAAIRAACMVNRPPNSHATHLLQVAEEADLRRPVPAGIHRGPPHGEGGG